MKTQHEYKGKSVTIDVALESVGTWKFLVHIEDDTSMVGYIPTDFFPADSDAIRHSQGLAEKCIDAKCQRYEQN